MGYVSVVVIVNTVAECKSDDIYILLSNTGQPPLKQIMKIDKAILCRQDVD